MQESGFPSRRKRTRQTLVWIPAATVAVLVAGYFALTAGTVWMMPDFLDEIEPGISQEELYTRLEAADVFVNRYSGYWNRPAEEHAWVCRRCHGSSVALGRVGLRSFHIIIEHPMDEVERVVYFYQDPHTDGWHMVRHRLLGLTGSHVGVIPLRRQGSWEQGEEPVNLPWVSRRKR